MKKVFITAFFVATCLIGAKAQSGNNQIGVGVNVGIPTGDFGDAFGVGIGGYVKGLLGVGSAGQVTLTTGYTSFGMKDEFEQALGVEKASATVIPILLGYRHNFSGFYAEPQIGYNILGARAKAAGVTGTDSEGQFAWAIGFGYVVSNFDIGARYESMHKDGSSTAFVGFRVGYNFSLGGAKSSK